MKKVLSKIFFILNIMIIIFSLTVPKAYAGEDKIRDAVNGAQHFLNAGNSDDAIKEEKLQDMSKVLYNTLFVIGVILAVGIGIFIGIQFMTSGVEQKAKIKETLIAYIAGCVVVFGAFSIWKLVLTILQSA